MNSIGEIFKQVLYLDNEEIGRRISYLEKKGGFERLIKNVRSVSIQKNADQFLDHTLDLNLAYDLLQRGFDVCHLESEKGKGRTGKTPEFRVSYERVDYYIEGKRISRPKEEDSPFWRESNPLKKVIGKFEESSEKAKNILVIERDVHSKYFDFGDGLGIDFVKPEWKKSWYVVNGIFPKGIRNINVIIVLNPRGTGSMKIERGARYWRHGTLLINDFSYNKKIVNQENPIDENHLEALFPANRRWLTEQDV